MTIVTQARRPERVELATRGLRNHPTVAIVGQSVKRIEMCIALLQSVDTSIRAIPFAARFGGTILLLEPSVGPRFASTCATDVIPAVTPRASPTFPGCRRRALPSRLSESNCNSVTGAHSAEVLPDHFLAQVMREFKLRKLLISCSRLR